MICAAFEKGRRQRGNPRPAARYSGSKLVCWSLRKFYDIEIVFTTDARGQFHRQLLAALLDLHVVG